jgi:SAM-dependent methyltransferase
MGDENSSFSLRNLPAWVTYHWVGFFRRRLATALIHEETWREPLIDAISPQHGERILVVGPNSTFLAIALAKRFGEVDFTAADCTQASIDRGQTIRGDLDVVLKFTALDQPLPFATASFDKVVSALALHELPPQEKLALIREARRTLRREGTLYAAEYDKPATAREVAILKTMSGLAGAEAAQPHIDGSWSKVFERVGFRNVRYLSNHPVGFGRVALMKVRKL